MPNSRRLSREKFYSIPNVSSDKLLNHYGTLLSTTTTVENCPVDDDDDDDDNMNEDGLKNMAFAPDELPINHNHIIINLPRRPSSTISKQSLRQKFRFNHTMIYYITQFLVLIFSIIFATLCCITVYQFKVEQLESLHQYKKLQLLQNTTTTTTTETIQYHLKNASVCRLFKTNLNRYYKIPANYLSLIFILLLFFVLFFFQNLLKQCQNRIVIRSTKKTCYLSFPMIFNPHCYTNRFESAAVFGLLALEVLHIFDEYIIHAYRHLNHGPLIDLIIQIGIGLLLGLRYFPILAMFEQKPEYKTRLSNILCYSLATMYLWTEIIFKLQNDINCTDKSIMSDIKETIGKLEKMGINPKQMLFHHLGDNRTTYLNETAHNYTSRAKLWYHNKISKLNLTHDEDDDVQMDILRLDRSLGLNKQGIYYNTFRYAPYYYYSTYLAISLTLMFLCEFIQLFRSITKQKTISNQHSPRWKYVQWNLLRTENYFETSSDQPTRLFRCLNFLIQRLKSIYSIRPYFRYSKLIVCIYVAAFTLIYYFTFWITDNTYWITKKILLFLNLLLCGLADLSKDLCYNLNMTTITNDINIICILTACVTSLQLLFGLRHYQKQMCNAYKGQFIDIPLPKHVSSIGIISKSVHYPGRFIGSLVYSYGFLFLFVSILFILSRYIFYSLIIWEYSAKLFLPMIIFFLFQLLFVRLLCKLLFIQNGRLLALKNIRLYYAFSYFSFFFDCFLGFIMCLSRITKAIICALIFFARLDYSPFGRGLEMYDSSYAAYVSFMHVERIQMHPVLNVFIDLVRDRLLERRMWKRRQESKQQQQEFTLEQYTRRQYVRFRWALVYTLVNNDHLKRYRKHKRFSYKQIQSKTLERLFLKLGFHQILPTTSNKY
ncbi:unnamed protein product [Didymodactylos carnosus]|uniref:Uncharacterized protein n=1 Tax=Didymodactylos carnosus TaxID=1234261 RepID=A0A814RXI8_9BILA|nr:unnamed protein product [Didymodactylos carnosus]CAF3904040.1 unnamed protein product [Didymodactylos carnosus]